MPNTKLFSAIVTIIAISFLTVCLFLSLMSITTAHARRIGHPPIISHRILVDLHSNGKATVDIESRSWTMAATCTGEGQLGVVVKDNQHKAMPEQKAVCDGKTHDLGTYSSTGIFTFMVISHATTVHFTIVANMLY